MFLDDLMIERLSVHPEVTNVSCTRNIVGIIRRGKKLSGVCLCQVTTSGVFL